MSEPTEQIDIRNNPESRAGERDTTQAVSRASDGGPVPRDVLAAGEQPEADPDGTAGGDPLAGVQASADDVADAVTPDTGPDELGEKGPQPNG